MTGKIAASGNVMSLLDETCQRMDVPDYCFNSLFNSCSSLTQAPELPATTLAMEAYSEMFAYCSNLTQAPDLPASTLNRNCYYSMFGGCTNL